MRILKLLARLAAPVALITLLATFAAAADNPANVMNQPDDSWINISGTVESVEVDEEFVLNYGPGTIEVEFDDGDVIPDEYRLVSGDKVTVVGRIDDDLFERREIEATSVYIEKLGTQFSNKGARQQNGTAQQDQLMIVQTPVLVSQTVIQGMVTAISGEEEFIIDTGARRVQVEVDKLNENPLDAEGFQRIQVGDLVSVTGEMDYDLFEGREFVAQSIVKFQQ